MQIQIQSVSGERFGFSLGNGEQTVSNANSLWNERESLRIEVIDCEGTCGQGEVCPLPGYSRETLDEALMSFKELRPMLAGAFEVNTSTVLQSISTYLDTMEVRLASLRCGLEMAFLDLLANKLMQPISKLLHSTSMREVQICGLIYGQDSVLRKQSFQKQWDEGIRSFKFKIDPYSIETQMDELQQLRETFKETWQIRLDANQSFDVETWNGVIQRLERLDVAWVEEPVPFEKLMHVDSARVPIALDESLQHESWKKRLLQCAQSQNLAAVILKPMALGGFSLCQEIVDVCKTAAVIPVVSHLFEGDLGFSANVQFAASLNGSQAMGLYPHVGLHNTYKIKDGCLTP